MQNKNDCDTGSGEIQQVQSPPVSLSRAVFAPASHSNTPAANL
jgi:hypothetical protein